MNFNNSYMQDGQFLLKLTLEMTNYFANKQDHVMKDDTGIRDVQYSTVGIFLKVGVEGVWECGKVVS